MRALDERRKQSTLVTVISVSKDDYCNRAREPEERNPLRIRPRSGKHHRYGIV